jgi:hypothetical protein
MQRHGLRLRFEPSCVTVQRLDTQLGDEGTKRCSSTGAYHFQRRFSGKMCGVCFGSFTVSSDGYRLL